MRRNALLVVACVLVFGVFWLWPAFHQPADHTCAEDSEGAWSYKIGSRKWDCTEWGWHITLGHSVYGFGGI